jgi:hypothetical protein
MEEIREYMFDNCNCKISDYKIFILTYISYRLLNQIQHNISLSNEILDLANQLGK